MVFSARFFKLYVLQEKFKGVSNKLNCCYTQKIQGLAITRSLLNNSLSRPKENGSREFLWLDCTATHFIELRPLNDN